MYKFDKKKTLQGESIIKEEKELKTEDAQSKEIKCLKDCQYSDVSSSFLNSDRDRDSTLVLSPTESPIKSTEANISNGDISSASTIILEDESDVLERNGGTTHYSTPEQGIQQYDPSQYYAMINGEIEFSNRILNGFLEFEGTNKELTISEILEAVGYDTLEEVVDQGLSHKPVPNLEALEEEHEDTEKGDKKLKIPREVDQIETNPEHISDLGQIEIVHDILTDVTHWNNFGRETCTSGQNQKETKEVSKYATANDTTISDVSNRKIIGKETETCTSRRYQTETKPCDTKNTTSCKEIKPVGFSEDIMCEKEDIVETQDEAVLKESTEGIISEPEQASECTQTIQREQRNLKPNENCFLKFSDEANVEWAEDNFKELAPRNKDVHRKIDAIRQTTEDDLANDMETDFGEDKCSKQINKTYMFDIVKTKAPLERVIATTKHHGYGFWKDWKDVFIKDKENEIINNNYLSDQINTSSKGTYCVSQLNPGRSELTSTSEKPGLKISEKYCIDVSPVNLTQSLPMYMQLTSGGKEFKPEKRDLIRKKRRSSSELLLLTLHKPNHNPNSIHQFQCLYICRCHQNPIMCYLIVQMISFPINFNSMESITLS